MTKYLTMSFQKVVIIFYFRLVLTEKLGMNLRNDFAHGFGKKKFFGRDASDRLFHVVMRPI